jgi:Domain of unknown function (DUF4129)
VRFSVVLIPILCCAVDHSAAQTPPPAVSAASAPTREQVRAEVDGLRADPNLPGIKKEDQLRFKKDDDENKSSKSKSVPSWLRSLGRWISEAGRVFVWALAALALALVLVGLRHWVRERGGAALRRSVPLPSHVRDLDIRPESLPEHIGAAARLLWQRGETRAALSLLYRGALSRLVHQHVVPVSAASTEGECMALAARCLAPQASAYFGRLVGAWQLAVYGARLPEEASVLALCADFDAALGAHARSPGVAAP